jgi:Phospholipase_D-nuclease N-terminal
VFAYDYPLVGVFWSIVLFFMLLVWLFLLFRVFADIFRSHDMGGWVKVLWMILVILLPFLGIVIYFTVRGTEMGQREWASTQATDQRFSRWRHRW